MGVVAGGSLSFLRRRMTWEAENEMQDATANPYERLIVPFGPDTTIRWSCRQGDTLALVRCENIFADIHDAFVLVDTWCMRDGDFVTITNRVADLPPWFKPHLSEVCGTLAGEMAASEVMQGPNIWRLRTGDRVAWVGDWRPDRERIDGLLAVLDCRACAVALGEMPQGGLNELVEFGAPQAATLSAEDRARGQVMRRAIELMDVPDSIAFEWQLE